MPLTLAQLPDNDPRIHTVRGECGCAFRSTTSKYPDILMGRKVYLECPNCQRNVKAFPFESQKVRYCSSPQCRYPEVPLSRYNVDPMERCNLCQQREQALWIEQLQNPQRCARDHLRELLAEHGELTAVQLEQFSGVPVAKIYKHLIDLMKQGEVLKRRPGRALAVYALAEQQQEVAA